MTRTQLAVLLVPVALLLAACAPVPSASVDDSPTETPTASATVEPSEEPGELELKNADDYLIKGGLNIDTDGDGFWSAHYAFYTDDTHAVRCDLWIFSGDEPGVLCAIAPEAHGQIGYELPAGTQCDFSTSNPFDGYSLALGSKGLDTKAGWSGCAEQIDYSDDEVPVKVLGENQSIIVEPFTCVVNGAAAGCSYTDDSASIILGLSAAAHAG